MIRSSHVLQVLFLISGIMLTLTLQHLVNQGSANVLTFLPVTVSSLGSALMVIPQWRTVGYLRDKRLWFISFRLAVFDLAGLSLKSYGIQYAGSGTFQIIYSSIVIVVALLSRIFMDKKLDFSQWAGILITFGGLGVSAIGKEDHSDNMFLGIAFSFSCVVAYAVNYIQSEIVLKTDSPPKKELLQYSVGIATMILSSIGIIFYAYPKRNVLFFDEIKRHGGNTGAIIVGYIMICFLSLLHLWAYYGMQESSGSITTGIFQALRAIGVFISSSILYCDTYANQCITLWKTVSCIIVIAGVLIYSVSPVSKKEDEKSNSVTNENV